MSLRVQHWVGGKPLAPSSADWLQRHNAANGELVVEIARGDPSDVDRATEVTGNTVVAKPAEATSQSTARLAQLATEVGFLDGVFNVVVGQGAEVGEAIVHHSYVRKVAFTGSVAVGQTLGHVAADRTIPLRQVRSAGTCLLVQRDIYDEFVDKVCESAGQISVDNDLGPIITENQYQQVQRCFDEVGDEGLTPVLGGRTAGADVPHGGYFIEPTVYKDVDNSMRIAREEIFGPVLVTIPFDTESDAVQIANDSDYGLVGAVWSRDISRALRVAGEIEAGQVFVKPRRPAPWRRRSAGTSTAATAGRRASRRCTTTPTSSAWSSHWNSPRTDGSTHPIHPGRNS